MLARQLCIFQLNCLFTCLSCITGLLKIIVFRLFFLKDLHVQSNIAMFSVCQVIYLIYCLNKILKCQCIVANLETRRIWGQSSSLVELFGSIYTVRLVDCDKVVPCKSALTEGKTMHERSTRYCKMKLGRPRSLIIYKSDKYGWILADPSSFCVLLDRDESEVHKHA